MRTLQLPPGTLSIWRSARNTYVVPSLGMARSYHDSETGTQLRIWDLSLPISSLVCAQYLLFVLRDSSLSSETAARHAQRWRTQECGPIMLSHIFPSVHICKTQPWTCHLPAARVTIAQTAAQCSTTLRGGNYIVL